MNARRAIQAGSRSGMAVPTEICGQSIDAMWSSVTEVQRWYVGHGLAWAEGRMSHDEAPSRRRDRAAKAWSLSNGLANARFPKFLDHQGCREAGLTFAGSRRLRAEGF